MNFDLLSKESLTILAKFTDYLLETDTSVYEFFDEAIYNQIVRTKNKQSEVEIISANSFFSKMKSNPDFMKIINHKFLNESSESEHFS
jgi:hypothetical protein